VSDIVVSAVRTLVPYLVGLIITWLAAAHITVNENGRLQLTYIVTFVIAAAYYVLVRSLEKRWPKLGVLLGVPKAPAYGEALPVDDEPSDDESTVADDRDPAAAG